MASYALTLADTAATLELGRLLARLVLDDWPRAPGFALLLAGEVGAGKTTLTRGLVDALPGGDEAEVASPSFNLANLYPTSPPVAHLDLYRLEHQEPDETVLELLADPETLVIAEWSQYLGGQALPDDRLTITLTPEGDGRLATLTADGPRARAFLDRLARAREAAGPDAPTTP